jgi:hypothetical protein
MIDRVRHIGNMSSGNFGTEIGRQIFLHEKGKTANLTFLKAENSKSPFASTVNWAELSSHANFRRLKDLQRLYNGNKDHYTELKYKTYDHYKNMLVSLLQGMRWDVVILAAAVSDYIVANYVDGKIRSKDALKIELAPAEKLISKVKELNPECRLIGFKLLVDSTHDQLIQAAQESAIKNGCEYVIANDLSDIQASKHRLSIVNRNGLLKVENTDPNDPTYLAKVVAKLVLER